MSDKIQQIYCYLHRTIVKIFKSFGKERVLSYLSIENNHRIEYGFGLLLPRIHKNGGYVSCQSCFPTFHRLRTDDV